MTLLLAVLKTEALEINGFISLAMDILEIKSSSQHLD